MADRTERPDLSRADSTLALLAGEWRAKCEIDVKAPVRHVGARDHESGKLYRTGPGRVSASN